MLTSMRPTAGVNLTAFDSRFTSTCCKRAWSPPTLRIGIGRLGNRDGHIPLLPRSRSRSPMTSSPAGAIGIRRGSSCRLPRTILETSREVVDDLHLRHRVPVDRLQGPAPHLSTGRCRRGASPSIEIALSGVRSSCESVARNSSLSRLAAFCLFARVGEVPEQVAKLVLPFSSAHCAAE
jgi:hypothetical protein